MTFGYEKFWIESANYPISRILKIHCDAHILNLESDKNYYLIHCQILCSELGIE